MLVDTAVLVECTCVLEESAIVAVPAVTVGDDVASDQFVDSLTEEPLGGKKPVAENFSVGFCNRACAARQCRWGRYIVMTECFAFGNGLTAISAVGRKGRGGRGSRVGLRHITCLTVDKACERGNCSDIRKMHGNRAARYSTMGCNKTVLLRGPIEGMPKNP